ncbi:Folic acid synthesis protein fol1, partial [Pseudocercospora fuligena]
TRDTQNASSEFKIVLPSIILSASIHQGQEVSNQSITMHTQFGWKCSDLQHWRERDISNVAKDLYAHLHHTASSLASENDFASYHDVVNAMTKAVRSSAPTLSSAATIRTSAIRASPSRNAASKSGMSSLVFSSASGHVEAFIALGSNIGNRLNTIEQACCALEKDQNIRILETSPLYETKAMYVEDQDSFVNGVCKIQTDLPAMQLLDRLQAIENDLGRVKTIDKGPRNIDLDILTYGYDVIRSERLTVPHALMHEREFVLRPMSDISGGSYRISRPGQSLQRSASTALKWLHSLPPSDPPMYALTPLSPGSETLRALHPQRRTSVMSILNVTPDSFSDGGDNHNSDMETLRQTIAEHIAGGATIIDIGGQSSRPNAPDITAEEEISRILPAIEAIKSLPEASNIAISIDTYRASVAEAAIKAGAHIINDISAGLLDPEMLPTIARLGCTYIMMHMRGTPATMQSEENTSYPDGLIPTIASELQSRLQAAQEAGIRRWRIILDPGVGFAKTTEQNAELLGKFSELRNRKGLATYPW